MAEFIYTMRKARKAHGDKVILDDVTLSFLPGREDRRRRPQRRRQVDACCKIMAGLDHASNGDAILTPGYTVGILEQEPQLNEAKDVLGNVEEGVGRDQGASSTATTRSPRRWPTDYSDALMDEMGKLQEEHRPRRTPGTSTPSSSRPWTRCAARRRTPTSSVLSGGERRRVALCKLLLQPARPAAARRAHQPPRRRERAVAGAAPGEVRRAPSSPSPTTGTSWTTWPSGSSSSTAAAPTPTRATTRPTWRPRQARLKVEGRKDAKRAKRLKEELEWVRSNAKGAAGQEQGAPASATRRWPPRPRRPASSTSRRSRSRRARGWAASWSRSTT